jgi:ABC-type sugar transport system ATPase subunit
VSAPDAPAFLTTRGLAKTYPGVRALHDGSLSIAAGEIVGLVGKNGAGKSTLIKILAGVVSRDGGEILIDGTPEDISSPQDARRLGLAFVHQELALAPNLSVAENILLGLGYPKSGPFVRWSRLRRQARTILERLDASVDVSRPASALAPVEQRLVMIARALAQNARLLVLDEPSASLANAEIEHLHRVVRSLAADGVSVIYISHRLDEILTVTSRTIVMRDGAIVDARATADLGRDSLVELITGGHHDLTEHRVDREREAPAADADIVLRVDNLRVHPDAAPVSLDVRRGEVLGIAGLVGSGRTELVRAIFGADGTVRGDVDVHGERVGIRSPQDAIRSGIVLLPEDRRHEGAVLDFSVARNLTLVTLKAHRHLGAVPAPSRRRERRKAQAQIEELAIHPPRLDTPVRFLSGGNQQKVVLGKWLASDADVYMFDEPTQGIDVGAKEDAFLTIDVLAAAGKAIVLICSDFAELVSMCDRVIALRDGEVVADIPAAGLSEAALITACYAAA